MFFLACLSMECWLYLSARHLQGKKVSQEWPKRWVKKISFGLLLPCTEITWNTEDQSLVLTVPSSTCPEMIWNAQVLFHCLHNVFFGGGVCCQLWQTRETDTIEKNDAVLESRGTQNPQIPEGAFSPAVKVNTNPAPVSFRIHPANQSKTDKVKSA